STPEPRAATAAGGRPRVVSPRRGRLHVGVDYEAPGNDGGTDRARTRKPVVTARRGGVIQHKLEVGSVDDPLEAEADDVARQVLPGIGGRTAAPTGAAAAFVATPSRIARRSGDPGHALPLAPISRLTSASRITRRASSPGERARDPVEPMGADGGPLDATIE